MKRDVDKVDNLDKIAKECYGDEYNSGRVMLDGYITQMLFLYTTPIYVIFYLFTHLFVFVVFGVYLKVIDIDGFTLFNKIYSYACIIACLFNFFLITKMEKRYYKLSLKISNEDIIPMLIEARARIRELKRSLFVDLVIISILCTLYIWFKYCV